MWSIIAFRDNSVEVVPSKWYDSGVCAWPKRNLKQCIDQQLSPNLKEFRYLKGRKLGNDTKDFNIAQEKANIAKTTSDLSTNESSHENDNNKEHSGNKQKRRVCQREVQSKKSLWSPGSSDIFDDSDTDPHYTIPKINQGTSLSPQIKSTKPQNIPLTWPQEPVRKKLHFDKCLKNANQNEQTPDDQTTIIHTLSSPFKVSTINNTTITSTPLQSNSKLPTSNDNIEIFDKLNRNILNIKYEVKSLHDKIDKLENLIVNIRSNTTEYSNEDATNHDKDSFQYIINNEFPLKDEDSLQKFEDKLIFDPNFKTQMVNELSRYVRNTLPSTIRSIMRYLFKDSLLQEYSYKGQKKKKIFSTLKSCSIIFELDNADLYVPVDPNKIPKFLNKPSTYQVVTKDTIVLPCEVYNPENFVLAWKKGIAILTAGTTKVTPEERIRIVEGYNLEIRNVQINDAGNYICQIGTLEPVELKHTLQILIPPRIIGITSNGKVSAKKGSDVTLQCNSTGNPPPTITWSRKNNMLPNGEKTFIGNSYTIESVRRQADGVYICTASNNIGTTVNEEIDLNILYPPEVKEEQSIVFTVEGQETEIVCIVHAEPKADVLWYRDTLQLDMTEWRITDVRGNRYTLRLRKVQKTDFGNYSCVADNGLGKSKRSIEVTGRPDVAVITSSKQSRSKNSYEMLWTVKSYSPIIEYKLLYRQDKTNKSNQEIQYKRPMRRWNDDWTELLLNPASTDQLEKSRTETIRDLDPGTKYEATVQSRNRYGWSEVSQSFFFTTSTKNEAHPGNSVLSDPELRDMSITAINNKAVSKTIQTLLLCIMAMVTYYLA